MSELTQVLLQQIDTEIRGLLKDKQNADDTVAMYESWMKHTDVMDITVWDRLIHEYPYLAEKEK